MAASLCTAEKMAFIIRHTSGIVCAPITTEDARRLRLDPMVAHNESNHTTAFTVSIDYKPDNGTGISAEERASCCRALANPNAAVERVVALPAYREHVLAWAPSSARHRCAAPGVFLGYDFHLGNTGPQLIEINTNAGGGLLNALLARARSDRRARPRRA